MSVRVMADVWDSAMQGGTAVHVMAVLANSADDDGMNCFPGTRLIARRARVSERTVIRTIQELESCGYLAVVQRGAGAGRPSEYRLNVRRLHEEAEKTREADRERRQKKGCHGVTFPEKKRVTSAPKKGDIDDKKGDIDAAPLYVLPVNDPSPDLHPQPLASEGRVEIEVGHAVDQVCSALGIANRRKRRLLRDVILLEGEKGEPAATTALAMIAAWREQAENAPFLRMCGMDKFFGLGLWRDKRRWFWDKEALREAQRAGVGVRR